LRDEGHIILTSSMGGDLAPSFGGTEKNSLVVDRIFQSFACLYCLKSDI